MNTFGPYQFQAPNGKHVTVEVYVDPAQIAGWLADRASNNGERMAKACGGAVLVKAIHVQEPHA